MYHSFHEVEVGKKKRSRLKPCFLVIKITLKRFLEGFLVRLTKNQQAKRHFFFQFKFLADYIDKNVS